MTLDDLEPTQPTGGLEWKVKQTWWRDVAGMKWIRRVIRRRKEDAAMLCNDKKRHIDMMLS